MKITHPKCGKSWSGKRAQHCPACCQTFTGSRAGDLHRAGNHAVERHCREPEDAGLIWNEKRQMWGLSGTWKPDEEREGSTDGK